ncbi:MAG TPA: peptidase S8, partial [Planctomycetaceae bacterium]|nr:peptidase S8 [Planctomycetaceae bacterium]
MRLRLRRRAQRRPATFEPLETRCVLSSLSWEVGPVRPLPTEESVQTALESFGRFGDGVQLDNVRSLYGLTGQGQTVAVIDTGIAYDQRALGGGFGPEARVVGGWDVAERDSDPYDDAPAGFHGTHVAGILAAADDRRPGIAPGVDLVALRVFDDLGNGKLEWVEQALQWIARHRNAFRYPITTVNLSLGTNYNGDRPPDYAVLEDELKTLWESGILVVAAAGNSFAQYGRPGVSYPAASPYVLPVASLDANGRLSR